MIIEGKHPEVGHGIFISDIQEGSIADQVCFSIVYIVVNCLYMKMLVEAIEFSTQLYASVYNYSYFLIK